MNKEEKYIEEMGEKDLEDSSDIRDIMLDEYEDTEFGADFDRHEKFESSTFGMHASKIKDLQERLSKQGV